MQETEETQVRSWVRKIPWRRPGHTGWEMLYWKCVLWHFCLPLHSCRCNIFEILVNWVFLTPVSPSERSGLLSVWWLWGFLTEAKVSGQTLSLLFNYSAFLLKSSSPSLSSSITVFNLEWPEDKPWIKVVSFRRALFCAFGVSTKTF